MTQIILDFSANTHKNDKSIIKRAIDEIKAVDSGKHEIVFKGQLFKEAGENIVCTHEAFEYMYEYGNENGYKVTSSVFDKESLDFLLKFDIPFVKIANRPDLYSLMALIPRGIPIYFSSDRISNLFSVWRNLLDIELSCISKYPASLEEYEERFISEINYYSRPENYSDHTIGLSLFKRYQPKAWEKHLKLSDSTGLDAGSFAITPQELKEIL